MQQTLDVSSGARAFAQGLGVVAEVADRIDLRDAQAKASTAEATITSDWLKWDSANRSKYRGANADGYAPAAEAWWKSAAENAGKDLDPRAKLLASQNLRAKQTAAMGNVLVFTGAEKERHADETYAADVNTTIQFGVTSGDVASTAKQIRDKAAVLGARKGWTTEQVQAEAGKNLSSMHLAQITKLAEVNAAEAQKYYDENKAEVGFQNQARVEQVLKGELDNQFAKAEALRVSALPLEQQKAELIKITDPKRLEKTQIELNNLSAIDRRVREQTQDAARDQVYQRFEQNQPIPEALLSAMGGPERSQFENLRLARSKREAKGESVTTNWDTYVDLRERLFAGEEVNLRAYTEKIAGPQMEQLLDVKNKAFKEPEARTSEAQLRSATAELKLKGKNLGQFQAAYGEEVNAFIKENGGKKPNYDQRVDILDRLTNDVVTSKGLLWDSTEKGYLLPKDQRKGVSTQTTPAGGSAAPKQPITTLYQIGGADRQQITEGLRARGQAVTEENIQRVYANWKGK